MNTGVDLLTIFTTGLLTGGLTCMAVQGGLLAAILAQRESAYASSVAKALADKKATADREENLKQKLVKSGHILPILSFLTAKLIAYTILGFLLGWLGSIMQLSLQVKVILQIAAAIFMIGTALNILNAHPVFRYFVIQPPRFLTRLVRKQSKRNDIFAPSILGAFTIFIPCGTTQAMMALAVVSGQPLLGAVILFAFVLGTSPLFFLLGYLTMKLGDVLHQSFMRLAAFAIILIAVLTLDAAIALTGSPYTGGNALKAGFCVISYCDADMTGASAAQLTPVTEQTVTISATGYEPSRFAVKSGTEVKLHLVNNGAAGCIQAFTIPSLNVQKIVSPNTTSDITFTAPSKPGTISFMCSMGMYPGTIEVL